MSSNEIKKIFEEKRIIIQSSKNSAPIITKGVVPPKPLSVKTSKR